MGKRSKYLNPAKNPHTLVGKRLNRKLSTPFRKSKPLVQGERLTKKCRQRLSATIMGSCQSRLMPRKCSSINIQPRGLERRVFMSERPRTGNRRRQLTRPFRRQKRRYECRKTRQVKREREKY